MPASLARPTGDSDTAEIDTLQRWLGHSLPADRYTWARSVTQVTVMVATPESQKYCGVQFGPKTPILT